MAPARTLTLEHLSDVNTSRAVFPAAAGAAGSKYHTLSVLFLALFATGLLPHAALSQHLNWQQFSLNEGLPSNEVNRLVQDRRGIVWAATYQGICYFNGYRFFQPVDTSVMVAISALNPWEDDFGRIWFSHLPSSLWMVENDTVRPWKYNQELGAYQKKYGYIGTFALDKDGIMKLGMDRAGYLSVTPDGQQKPMGPQQPSWNFMEVNRQMLEVVVPETAGEGAGAYSGLSPEVFHWTGENAVSLGRFPLIEAGKGISLRVWRLRNGDFLLCRQQTFYLIHHDKLVWHGQKDVYVEDIYQDFDGSIMLCSIAEGISGLLRYATMADFQRDVYENLLPGHEVMSLLCDNQGGWWASTRDAGIFYCKNPHLDIFDTSSGLPSNYVVRLTTDGGRVFAGLRPFNICAVPIGGGQPTLIPYPPGNSFKELTALRFDALTSRLWCGADLGFWADNCWRFSEKTPQLSHGPEKSIATQNIIPDPGGNLWWTNYRTNFASVDRRTGLVVSYETSQERIFSVTPDPAGFLWVTTLSGLRIWRNGQYELPPFNHPALSYPLRGVDLLPAVAGGGMVIRLRGGGLLIRSSKGEFTHLTQRSGLVSDVFTSVYVSAEGVVYACSNAGLNYLTHQPDGSWKIDAVTVKHGLPSNQVNDVALIGTELWVATDKGLARFKTHSIAAPTKAPLLEFFEVNNHPLPFKNGIHLRYSQNNLSFQFFTPPIIAGGNSQYQYRLLPANTEFALTANRQVNFVSLQPGKYQFEVQSGNEDGLWSDFSVWEFEIEPPWWQTWWFRLLALVAMAGVAWLFVRYRLQTVRAEGAMKQKITDLQTAALRAQMNPHFIFNCLASIQNFISENDAKSATRYLARFARLVRLALHGSLDGTHSLAEELEMLDAYLTLEQLRFRHRFAFQISIEETLPSRDIQLPPMLVQPFVENAIFHGMKNKTDGGNIELDFSLSGTNLLITISDNGPGIQLADVAAGKEAENGHKSVGMSLTQNRLELLSGKSSEKQFSLETTYTETGIVSGTKVTLTIPVRWSDM